MREDSALAGMGATTIAMLRSGNKLAMAHIGDSRAYLLRERHLQPDHQDHSFVQTLLDTHRITEAEAQHHPQRSLVTRVMTGNPDDEPDLSIRELLPGDRYLLCSDGLTDFVSPDIVAEIITAATTPDEAADRCIELALKASTRDNVTVVVADVVDSNEEDDLPAPPRSSGRRRPSAHPAQDPRDPFKSRREGRCPHPRGVRHTRRRTTAPGRGGRLAAGAVVAAGRPRPRRRRARHRRRVCRLRLDPAAVLHRRPRRLCHLYRGVDQTSGPVTSPPAHGHRHSGVRPADPLPGTRQRLGLLRQPVGG
ncbi:MAG: serine/threonine-protein phosphatase [Actinomycetales bacterium]|nr:serine/threonine-protein phosphatase [Candidatus Phosphoribacter baldrii]